MCKEGVAVEGPHKLTLADNIPPDDKMASFHYIRRFDVGFEIQVNYHVGFYSCRLPVTGPLSTLWITKDQSMRFVQLRHETSQLCSQG